MATRLSSLPNKHPLTKLIKKSVKARIRRHKSPLHNLARAYRINPQKTEMLLTDGRNPAKLRKIPFTIKIAADKEEAKAQDKAEAGAVRIYTDGSAHDGLVGAAVVLWKKGKKSKILRFQLGTAEEHTVFEAKLVGLILGLQLATENIQGKANITVGIDNQATIKAMKSKLNKPGHYLAAEVLKCTSQLHKKLGNKSLIKLCWMPGHVGIKGNEEADVEAKKATEGQTSRPDKLPHTLKNKIKISKSALNQSFKEKRRKEWKEEWSKSPRYKRAKSIDSSLLSKKFMALISNPKISRAATSKIFQLRTRHIPLKAYLHKIKCAQDASCDKCGYPRETPQHYLLECPEYEKERRRLLEGRSGSKRKFASLVTDEEHICKLANYITETKRFHEVEVPVEGKGS